MPPTRRPLDRIDRALLAALAKNARASNKELAALVGLAPSSCLERVRRLRDAALQLRVGDGLAVAALSLEVESDAIAAAGVDVLVKPLSGASVTEHV
ncbi:MAG: AsnC family transcriptional regulator, partial [Gemmatimonadota bacterium]